MGNIPVVHETVTSFQSLGDAITGDTEGARKRWEDYSESSVIGSGIKSAAYAASGDLENANRLGKAMGRATGSMILGGGVLRSVPLFHELATCGDSLGDMIGGGDNEAARQRWTDYSERSVIGSGSRALIALANDDRKEAARLGKATGEAAANAVVSVTTIGAAVAGIGSTVITDRVLITAESVVSPTSCCLHGTYCGTVGNIAENSIQDQKTKPGDAIAAVIEDATTAVIGDVTAVVIEDATVAVIEDATTAVTGDATETVTEDATEAVIEDATIAVIEDVAGMETWVILVEDEP